MSNLLKKEKIVAKSVSSIATNQAVKKSKKRNIFNNHSVNEDCSNPIISNNLQQSTNEEEFFVSPIVGTFKVTAKIRIGEKIEPLPVDNEEIVYLYE